MSDHADIVREALGNVGPTDREAWNQWWANALAALDALVAERDEARRKLDMSDEYHRQVRGIVREAMGDNLAYVDDDVRLIVARAEAAEKERDEARDRGNTWHDHFENVNSQLKIKQVECDDTTARALAAEAEVARLREALEQIAEMYDGDIEQDGTESDAWVFARSDDFVTAHGIARAALGEDA